MRQLAFAQEFGAQVHFAVVAAEDGHVAPGVAFAVGGGHLKHLPHAAAVDLEEGGAPVRLDTHAFAAERPLLGAVVSASGIVVARQTVGGVLLCQPLGGAALSAEPARNTGTDSRYQCGHVFESP